MNNHSDNGTSIEVSCFYDYSPSQFYFDNNFTNIGNNNNSLWFYVDFGNIKAPEIEDLYVITDRTRDAAIKEMTRSEYSQEELEKMTNKELDNEFKNFYSQSQYYDYDDIDFFEFDSLSFGMIETRGYSQGDYEQVFYKKEDQKKGIYEPDEELIHELFWDPPVYFHAEIDGEEFDCSDFLTSDYDLDIDEIKKQAIEYVKKHFTEVQAKDFEDFINENLNEIKYN